MAEDNKLHVIMFPWVAFGHMIPFLELSKFIAQRGHKISYVSTPRNVDRLPRLPSNLAPLINFVKLPLPRVDEIPQNAESTMDVRNEDIQYLKKAFDGLEPELIRFLKKAEADWIIYDFAPHWLPAKARRLGMSCAYFNIINAWFIAFLGPSPEAIMNNTDERTKPEDFTVPPKYVPFPTKVAYRLYEINWMINSGLANASGISDIGRSGAVMYESDVLLHRHCLEFEPEWLGLLEKLHHKPMIPLGLMPPSLQDGGNEQQNETWLHIKEWLDGQNKRSVVYVAMGSEVTLSQNEITELALGLELSGLHFFWTLRRPPGSKHLHSDSDFVELPEGFEVRTKGRRMLWKNWAPQLRILSHEAVGGFLTHCGWSSIIEGLMFGQPLILLPFIVDQGLNARVLEDKKVGIEIPRDERDGSFTRHSIAKSLKLVIVEDGGKIYKDEAKKMSVIFGDKNLHDKYMGNAITYLENFRAMNKGLRSS